MYYKKNYSLENATDVLLTGCSAGGLATFIHSDNVYNMVSNIKGNENDFNYMSMPDGGYFLEIDYYIQMMQFHYTYGNVTGSLNQNCVNYYAYANSSDINIDDDDNQGAMKCMFAPNIAPFIQTKVLAIQDEYDWHQILVAGLWGDDDGINKYGRNMTKSFVENFIDTSDNHYGWMISCFSHCIIYRSQFIIDTAQGMTAAQAQVNAWFNNATIESRLSVQNKTYPCNCCAINGGSAQPSTTGTDTGTDTTQVINTFDLSDETDSDSDSGYLWGRDNTGYKLIFVLVVLEIVLCFVE